MPKANDILECGFLDRRLNRIIILMAATLVLFSIIAIGIVTNMGLENAKGCWLLSIEGVKKMNCHFFKLSHEVSLYSVLLKNLPLFSNLVISFFALVLVKSVLKL